MRVIKIETDQRKLGMSIKAYIEATGEDPLVKRGPEPEPEPEPQEETLEGQSADVVTEDAARPAEVVAESTEDKPAEVLADDAAEPDGEEAKSEES
jgi:hypothetical protein